jgi:hypothetical protein
MVLAVRDGVLCGGLQANHTAFKHTQQRSPLYGSIFQPCVRSMMFECMLFLQMLGANSQVWLSAPMASTAFPWSSMRSSMPVIISASSENEILRYECNGMDFMGPKRHRFAAIGASCTVF